MFPTATESQARQPEFPSLLPQISPIIPLDEIQRPAKNLKKVKSLFKILMLLVLSALMLTSCESNNTKVRKKVIARVRSVTPKTILEAAAKLDQKPPEEEGTLIPLDTLPTAFSAFDPMEVWHRYQGAYLIVTDRTVQHRTGLWIAAPTEIVPVSTKYLTYEKLGDRLYFYQD